MNYTISLIQINAPYRSPMHSVRTHTSLPEPVLIYHRILVAVDLTESSFTIAERGRALAAALGSDLEMLHVVEPPPVVAPMPPDAVTPAIIKTQEELIEAAQKHMANLAGEPGSKQARWRIEVGRGKVELLRVARSAGL